MDTAGHRRYRALASFLIAGLIAGGLAAQEGRPDDPFAAGRPLTEALLELQTRGLRLVFSTRVVSPDLRVLSRPVSSDLRSVLEELLSPHGLAVEEAAGGSLVVVARSGPPPVSILRGSVREETARTPLPGVTVRVVDEGVEAVTGADGSYEIRGLKPGTYSVQARRPGFVIEERGGVAVAPGATSDASFLLHAAPLTGEDVVVHPSRIEVLQEDPTAPFALNREEIIRLPHLGGDVFRTLSLLPGTASNDITAQFHVRGGRRDEVLVLLDGQELYEAYHLKDFDSALSVVAASGLANLDLTTGAFPSSYGDRMGGILDLTTLTPSRPRGFRLSLSILNAQAEGSGTLGERAWWMASLRRGTTDLAGKIFGEEDPTFWDLFGKVSYRLGSSQSLRLNVLHSADRLTFTERDGEELTQFNTEYDNSYLWLTHQWVASERLFVNTALSASRVVRDRRGQEIEEEKDLDVLDDRDLGVTGVLQSWSLQLGARQSLKAGVELRRFEADYDYRRVRNFESPFAGLRSDPSEGEFLFRGELHDEYLGAYFSHRYSPADVLTVELGLRYDRHSLTGDDLVSPRASVAWKAGPSSVVRVGWGHYHQTQRAYELLIEDGETGLYPAERSEHWVVGFEHLFAGASHALTALRAEVYRRRVTDPRPRYENLLEPFEPFPEGELVRLRIEPERGIAEGAEVFLKGRAGRRLGWWLNYAYATTEDEIGGGEVPRQVEQRHTVNVDVNYRLGRSWDVNMAWRFHTGWRVTPVSLQEVEGELVPVLGRLNSARLPDYHRLDLRVSKRWPLASGSVTLFVDVQNAYDRSNVGGYDLEIDEEEGRIVANDERWPGFFPSLGVSWEF
jgi:outer membrane receptor protein involved in Fe transport